ncbi:LytR C-terminal domain-containing protein [Actinoplanes couchii]|uniref:LytR C-terminal domain-containing protein n=1 Tax=Actinoplanes couchii TaxID=403638 RepID=UPI00194373E6|nr:LytR C-terminal domain-containing protein [Actinoplanes couchii]MDR6323335.1 hypothetical protein [Actinoplanes couchii]
MRDLEMQPAAEVRERGRRRGRRQLVAVAGAVVMATTGVAVAWPTPQPGPQPAADRARPSTEPALDCAAMLPRSPSEVRVRVVDGGAPSGVAAEVAAELRKRDFDVVDGGIVKVAGTYTSVTHSPATLGEALLVMAMVHGRAGGHPDPTRTEEVVGLVVGEDFDRLATPTEVNQALTELGRSTRPEECR